MESRIIELEIKASFAEDMIDTLNRTIFRQQQQIDLLANEIRSLREQLRNNPATEALSLRDELPPHY